MTIAKTDARKQYAGNGSTTPFSFPYRFFADSDLQVYLLVDATGVETLQTLTTHYTVSNNGDETGGTVTMVTAPATGETLTILRAVPQTQGTDYAANDPFPAETHEAALDRVTLLAQQLQEELGRALVAPASESASLELPLDRGSLYLAFDSLKNPIAVAGTTVVPVATVAEIRNKTTDKVPTTDNIYAALDDVALIDGATIEFDCDLRFNGSVILDGNRTLNFTNPQAWQSGLLDVSQDGVTGGRTLAFQVTGGTGTVLGTVPTLSTATSARDLLGYLFVSATEVILWAVELGV